MSEPSASRAAIWLLAAVALTSAALPRITSAADEEEDAVKVYKQLKPSVVSLKCAEGSGTGVVIDASGLILTNAHVVSSPTIYEVRLDVDGPGKGASTVT